MSRNLIRRTVKQSKPIIKTFLNPYSKLPVAAASQRNFSRSSQSRKISLGSLFNSSSTSWVQSLFWRSLYFDSHTFISTKRFQLWSWLSVLRHPLPTFLSPFPTFSSCHLDQILNLQTSFYTFCQFQFYSGCYSLLQPTPLCLLQLQLRLSHTSPLSTFSLPDIHPQLLNPIRYHQTTWVQVLQAQKTSQRVKQKRSGGLSWILNRLVVLSKLRLAHQIRAFRIWLAYEWRMTLSRRRHHSGFCREISGMRFYYLER